MEQDYHHEIITNILINDPKFLGHIENIVRKFNNQQSTDLVKNLQKKYPWDKPDTIENITLVNELETLLVGMIQTNLNFIINRDFNDISDQLIKMRDHLIKLQEDSDFKLSKLERDLRNQIEDIRKKIATNNITNNTHKEKLFRTTTSEPSKLLQAQITQMKLELQKVRASQSTIEQSATSQQVHHLQMMVSDLKTQLKIKVEENKQKTNKAIEGLQAKINEWSSKETISNQVRKAMKANVKIYTEQFQKINKKVNEANEQVAKDNSNMQQYIGSQLKSVWLIMSNIKRRTQKIEQSCNINLMNSSFIME